MLREKLDASILNSLKLNYLTFSSIKNIFDNKAYCNQDRSDRSYIISVERTQSKM